MALYQLSPNHWILENFRQRMPVKEWTNILLRNHDSIIVAGRLRQLKAKSLGHGIVEIFKIPLEK